MNPEDPVPVTYQLMTKTGNKKTRIHYWVDPSIGNHFSFIHLDPEETVLSSQENK